MKSFKEFLLESTNPAKMKDVVLAAANASDSKATQVGSVKTDGMGNKKIQGNVITNKQNHVQNVFEINNKYLMAYKSTGTSKWSYFALTKQDLDKLNKLESDDDVVDYLEKKAIASYVMRSDSIDKLINAFK